MTRILTQEDEYGLILRTQYGDYRTLPILIEANAKRIEVVVKKLSRKARYLATPLSEQDLIQEGCIGFIEAVKKFDLSTGYRLWTYAKYRVEDRVLKAFYKDCKVVTIPHSESVMESVENQSHSLRDESDNLLARYCLPEDEFNQVPDLDVMSESPSWSPLELSGTTSLEDRFVDYLEKKSGRRILLEPRSEELMPYLPDDYDLEDTVIRTVEAELLTELLQQTLSEVEILVLTKRYGLGDEDTHTLAEVGRLLELSRERVRQIQRGAEEKLRGCDCLSSKYSKKSQNHVERLAQVA